MRGKESVYLSAAALSKLSAPKLLSMQERLQAQKGPDGGKFRRERKELAKRLDREITRRQKLGEPIEIFNKNKE